MWNSGEGSPEGQVPADVGSIYLRTDGGSGTTLYLKESGESWNGWVAVTSGSEVATLRALVDAAELDIAALEAANVLLDGRLDTAETDITALEAADVALDTRVDAAETSITALEAGPHGFLTAWTGSSWGTSTTRVWAEWVMDVDDVLTTTQRRLLIPFDMEIIGGRAVANTGVGGATITITLVAGDAGGLADTAFNLAHVNSAFAFATGPSEDWSGAPLALSAGDVLAIAIDKSATITSGGAGGQVVLTYRRV
jgi:hypothetical protein